MHFNERRITLQVRIIEKAAMFYAIIALQLAVRERFPFGKSDYTPEIKKAVIDNAPQNRNKTQMKQDHAKGDKRQLPAPHPREKTEGHVHYQQDQKSVEP
jgi:hypothetical protein